MPIKRLSVIVAAALTLRLLVFALGPACALERAAQPDTTRYVDLAENLLRYHSFGLAGEKAGAVHVPLLKLRAELGQLEPVDAHGLHPEVFRTPGYPLALALILRLGLPLAAILPVQAILSTVGVFLVYSLGRRLRLSEAAALLAAAIVALHPGDILFANSILSETLSTFLLLLSLWVSAGGKEMTWKRAGGAGLLLGLATLVRPQTIFLGPVLGLWLLFRPARRQPAVGPALVLVGASFLLPLAWMVRNQTVGFGLRFSSVSPISNLFYTAGYTEILQHGGDTYRDWPALVERYFVELRTQIKPGEDVFAAMNRLACAKISQQPAAYARTLGSSLVKFMLDHSLGQMYQLFGATYQPTGLRDALLRGRLPSAGRIDWTALILATAWTAWNGLLLAASVLGLAVLAGKKLWPPLLLAAGVIGYFLLTTQAVGLERFRLPVLGLQALAAAVLADHLVTRWRRKRNQDKA